MKQFLLKANKIVENNASNGRLPDEQKLALEQEYAKIILGGFKYHQNLAPLPISKKGKQKQRRGKNLLNRLSDKYETVLRSAF